jgi:hypothetical protein
MELRRNILRELIFGRGNTRADRARLPRKVVLSCDRLEERATPAHIGIAHHAVAHLHAAAHHSHASTSTASDSTSTSTASTSTSTASTDTSTGSTTTSSSSTLSSALATLKADVRTIELASDTTVGQLTAIMAAFQTLSSDGLTPSSNSALKSFENSLVTDYASGTTLTGNATLLSQFEALYTSSPTTQETTDLTTAYDALAAAVTSSNITSADITTINTDWAAVLAAEGSTSTATYPYFNLVTGQGGQGFGGGGPGGGGC